MADAAPPARLLNHRTTAQLLRHSSSIYASVLTPLLLAAAVLFSFRSILLVSTVHLTTVVDRDPSVRSLLTRISSVEPRRPPPSRRRSPFLHFTRTGTLDGDYFSDSDAGDHRQPSRLHRYNNLTRFVTPQTLAFSRTPKKFKIPPFDPLSTQVIFSFPNDLVDDDGTERSVDHQIIDQGLNLGRQDGVTILYLLGLLSYNLTFGIVVFILAYSCVLGVVFVAVTGSLLDNPILAADSVYRGVLIGVRRLSPPIFLRWSVRDAMVQFICIFFFSEIMDQRKLFKLFLRVKLMPLSLTAPFPLTPWFGPIDDGLVGFFRIWGVIDFVVSVALALNPFVLIMDYNVRRQGGDVLKEGLYLVFAMLPKQAILIKCLEAVACGELGRSVLTMVGGRWFAMVLQSVAEVYFMVAWLMFYYAARCKDAELEGQRFGLENLEDCLNEVR